MLNKINIGIEKDSGTGDTLRQGAVKINNNFEEVYNVLGLNGQSGDGNVAFVDTEQTLTNKTIQSSKTDSIINYDPINIPNSIKELYPDNHLLKATEDPFINTSYGSFSNYFFDEILPSISPDFENDLKVKFGIDSFENFINTLSAENQQLFIDKVIINKFYNNLVSKTHYDIDLADFFQSIASKLNLTKMKDWLVNTKKIYTRDANLESSALTMQSLSEYKDSEGNDVSSMSANGGLVTIPDSGCYVLYVNPYEHSKLFFNSDNALFPISYASDPNNGSNIAMWEQSPFTQILNNYTLMPMCYFTSDNGSSVYVISNTMDKTPIFFSFVDTDIAVDNWQSLYSVDGVFNPSLMPNDSLLFPENIAHVQSRTYGSKEILYITTFDTPNGESIQRDGENWQSKTIKKIDTSKIKILNGEGGIKYILVELRDIESVTYLFRSVDSVYAPFGMVSFSPDTEDEMYYTEYTTSSIASNIYKINLVFDGSENQVYFEGLSKTKTINSNTDNPFYTIPASENLFQFGPSWMTARDFNIWSEDSKLYGTISYYNIINNPPAHHDDVEFITLKINLTDSFSDPADSFERLTKESGDNYSFGHVIDNQFYIYDMKQGKLYNYNTPSEEYQLDDTPILTQDDNLWLSNRMYLIDKSTNNILYTRKEEPLSTTNSTYVLVQKSDLENVKLYNSLFNSDVPESDIVNNFISFIDQTGVTIDEYSFDMIISNWTDEAITDKSFFNGLRGLTDNSVNDSLEDLTNTLMEYLYFLRILESTNLDENIQYTVNTPALLASMEQFFHIDTFSNFVNENFINNNNQSALSYLHEYNILKNNLIDSSLIVNSNILLPTITKGSNKITKISISNGDSFLQKNKVTLQPNESFKSNMKGKYEIMDSVDPLISADCYFNGTNINIITVSDDISETISDSDKIVITVDGSDIKITNKFSTQKEIIIFQK